LTFDQIRDGKLCQAPSKSDRLISVPSSYRHVHCLDRRSEQRDPARSHGASIAEAAAAHSAK